MLTAKTTQAVGTISFLLVQFEGGSIVANQPIQTRVLALIDPFHNKSVSRLRLHFYKYGLKLVKQISNTFFHILCTVNYFLYSVFKN